VPRPFALGVLTPPLLADTAPLGDWLGDHTTLLGGRPMLFLFVLPAPWLIFFTAPTCFCSKKPSPAETFSPSPPPPPHFSFWQSVIFFLPPVHFFFFPSRCRTSSFPFCFSVIFAPNYYPTFFSYGERPLSLFRVSAPVLLNSFFGLFFFFPVVFSWPLQLLQAC